MKNKGRGEKRDEQTGIDRGERKEEEEEEKKAEKEGEERSEIDDVFRSTFSESACRLLRNRGQ